jgi:hypothetical protein
MENYISFCRENYLIITNKGRDQRTN